MSSLPICYTAGKLAEPLQYLAQYYRELRAVLAGLHSNYFFTLCHLCTEYRLNSTFNLHHCVSPPWTTFEISTRNHTCGSNAQQFSFQLKYSVRSGQCDNTCEATRKTAHTHFSLACRLAFVGSLELDEMLTLVQNKKNAITECAVDV